MLLKVSDRFQAIMSGGVKVDIGSFSLGSSYGYEPDGTETDIRGNLVYSGVPSLVNIIDIDTVEFVCVLDKDVGPFQFGEVALKTTDGQLFAIQTFDTLQVKTATPQKVPNKFVIEARIQLSPSLIKQITYSILSNVYANLPTISSIEDLVSPSTQGIFNKYLTGSQDDHGNVIECVRKSDTEWCFSTHQFKVVSSGSVASFSNVTNIVSPQLSAIESGNLTPGKYILQLTSGQLSGHCRMLLSNLGGVTGAEFLKPLNVVPSIGDTFVVFRSNSSILSAAMDAIEDSFIHSLLVKRPI